MLRTADEMKTQVEEAYEDYIMNIIDRAAKERKLWVSVPLKDVPSSVAVKLRKYGYKLNHADSVSDVKISWGSDAE